MTINLHLFGSLILGLTVVLSGCTSEPESTQPTSTLTSDPSDVPVETNGTLPPTFDGSTPNASRYWNRSYDFPGDTIAISFELTDQTEMTIYENLEKSTFGATDIRHFLGALLMYEPSRGALIVYAGSGSAIGYTDYYYYVETPAGAFQGEDYIRWVERWRSGENEMTLMVPPGNWTLISIVPGAIHTTYQHNITFDREVLVRGPVWGPLGFNFDERAFVGSVGVFTSKTGTQYERHCSVSVEHDMVGVVLTHMYGFHYLLIDGPVGEEEFVVVEGPPRRVSTLEALPLFRMYESGNWTFSVPVGVGIGYAWNLVGVDLPLPSKGYTGYHEDPERYQGCAPE